MVDICLTCGDAGFSNALIYCDECKASSVHIYCLAEIPADLNDVVWLCEDCDHEPRKLSFSPGSDSLGTKKDSSIQLDLDNIRKAQENEGRIKTDDKCSTDEALKSLDGKNVRLDVEECKELKMNLSDDGEKGEKHGKQVVLEEVLEEAESINTKKTDGQGIDLCEIDCSKDGEKHQNYNNCNNLDEVSLNAEARLLKTETHQLAITHSPDNYVPAQPIEQPIWRGHLCIPDKHFDGMLGLVAHLSNIACPRVGEEAKSLPLFLAPELLPRSTLWPKSFAKWGPSDDSIALYFFPDSESSERVFDGLVNDMISRNVAMKAVVQNAELLIFASTLMPMEFWRFQAKFYLWGVFRRKRCGRSAAVANGEPVPVPVPGEVTQVSDRHSPISPLSNTNRMSTSKIIMTELNSNEKLNGDNYKIWSMKIRYILEEQEALEAINKYMDEPEERTTTQYKRDCASYDAWRKKNSLARSILLSNMCKDKLREFSRYYLAKDIWSAVANRFGATSVTRLRSLTIKFDSYEKRSCHTMKKHSREMTNIQNLDREDARLKPNKSSTNVYMMCSSSQGKSWKKRKFQGKGDKEVVHVNKRKRFNKLENGKHHPKKKNNAKIKCFNCDNMGHFARDCTEPNKR